MRFDGEGLLLLLLVTFPVVFLNVRSKNEKKVVPSISRSPRNHPYVKPGLFIIAYSQHGTEASKQATKVGLVVYHKFDTSWSQL